MKMDEYQVSKLMVIDKWAGRAATVISLVAVLVVVVLGAAKLGSLLGIITLSTAFHYKAMEIVSFVGMGIIGIMFVIFIISFLEGFITRAKKESGNRE